MGSFPEPLIAPNFLAAQSPTYSYARQIEILVIVRLLWFTSQPFIIEWKSSSSST